MSAWAGVICYWKICLALLPLISHTNGTKCSHAAAAAAAAADGGGPFQLTMVGCNWHTSLQRVVDTSNSCNQPLSWLAGGMTI